MLCHPIIMKRCRRQGEEGFTLVELMIVVAIVGVSAALAIPNFQAMYARHELSQAASTVYQRMLMARATAIRMNTVITAVPATLADGSPALNFTAPLTQEVLPRQVGFIPAPPPPPAPTTTPIGFNGRGMSTAPSTPSTFQLQSVPYPELIYSVSVYPSGRVTLCRTGVVPCP